MGQERNKLWYHDILNTIIEINHKKWKQVQKTSSLVFEVSSAVLNMQVVRNCSTL